MYTNIFMYSYCTLYSVIAFLSLASYTHTIWSNALPKIVKSYSSNDSSLIKSYLFNGKNATFTNHILTFKCEINVTRYLLVDCVTPSDYSQCCSYPPQTKGFLPATPWRQQEALWMAMPFLLELQTLHLQDHLVHNCIACSSAPLCDPRVLLTFVAPSKL